MGGDHRAVTLDNAPIHPAVVVAAEIKRRHPFEFSPADIGAGGADEVIPASVRIEQCGGRDVPRLLRRQAYAPKKFLARILKRGLLGQGKSDRGRRPHPGRRRAVDRTALRLGNLTPGIAIGRMQPAAAEIDRTSRIVANRPGASAEALARFDQQTTDTGVLQSPARGHTGRATPDNHHLGIAIRHVLFCDLWKERTAAPPSVQRDTEAIAKARAGPGTAEKSWRFGVATIVY